MIKTKRALPILFAVMFLVMVGFGIIIPVLPFYAEEYWGLSNTIRFSYGRLFPYATPVCTNLGTEYLIE